MDSSTVFNEDPAAQARMWEEPRSQRESMWWISTALWAGNLRIFSQIRDIVKAVRVPVQVGGGIRSDDTIRMYLDIGVNTVILGTVAAKDPERV